MKKITAKFNSQCAETNLKLKKGDIIYYDTATKKAYHPTANKVKEFTDAENTKGYIQAQESAYFERYSGGYYNY